MNEFLLLAVLMIYIAISYRPVRKPKTSRADEERLFAVDD